MDSWLLCALALCAMPFTGAAQTTTDTVYHLHGSVVNSVTGRPIGRALVVSADRRLATMTNTDGQFTLDVSVPAAQAAAQASNGASGGSNPGGLSYLGNAGPSVMLMAQRPGYLPSRRGTFAALDSATETRSLTLRLTPSASIRGRVLVNGAEELQGLRVQLLRHAVQDGRQSWQYASSHPVGEDGTFQFNDLQPGEYTVATAEWAPGGFNESAAVTQQYPPDFLGDTANLDSSTKLRLNAGQSSAASLHLRAATYYSIRIPVQGTQPNSGANVRVASGAGFPLYQLGWNAHDSAVEGALPDGNYVVVVTQFGAQRSAAQIPLHVADAPVTHAPVGLTPLQDVAVSVRDERTQSDNASAPALSVIGPASGASPGLFLTARSDEPGTGDMGNLEMTTEGPVLRNMAPGRYSVRGAAAGHGYIASMTCDGVDLLQNALVVNDSGHTAPIQVTLRDDGGTISGTVNLAAAGLQAARILVLPSDGSGHVLFGYSNGTGTFQVTNVPPGSYRVLAIPADQPDTLPYRDPQAMRPFNSRGGAVTVTAAQTAQVQAELIGSDGADLQ